MKKVLHGDATSAASWRELLGDGKAQSLITDPPYCILTRRRKDGRERDPKDVKIERGPLRRFEDVREYKAFTKEWMTHAAAWTTPDAPWVIWTNLLGKQPIVELAKTFGRGHLWGEFVWGKKTREGNSGEELLRVVEVALVLMPNAPARLPIEAPAECWAVVAGYDDDGEAEKHGAHPSHKPFGVLNPLVRQWSKPNDVVVDPFAGSGSIPAAALRLGRSAVCLELEPEWAQRVNVRLDSEL